MKQRPAHTALVYSTDNGRICPDCARPIAQCVCKQRKPLAASDGWVRVSLETKGRAGKGVTVIKGIGLDTAALAALAKQLRGACGSGGTVKDGVIELQGDHCARAAELLQAQGYKTKRAGG